MQVANTMELNKWDEASNTWGPLHLTSRGRNSRRNRSWMGGRCTNADRPGCSNIHTHFLTTAKRASNANLVAHTFPTNTNEKSRLPHGSSAVRACVGLDMNPNEQHGMPPCNNPKGFSRRTSSSAFKNPHSDVRSPKHWSLQMSRPCLRWVAPMQCFSCFSICHILSHSTTNDKAVLGFLEYFKAPKYVFFKL